MMIDFDDIERFPKFIITYNVEISTIAISSYVFTLGGCLSVGQQVSWKAHKYSDWS